MERATSITSKQPIFLHTNNFTNPKSHSTTINQIGIQATSSSGDSSEACDQRWAAKLLRECASALSEKDSDKIHHLLWMLNELASPYGDCDQKLASYFSQALFCKATGSGQRCYRSLIAVAEKSHSFDSARKLILKFQEVSPWTTFGHVASNGAMLEALEGETKIHIIDISNTLCTQWPTFLEALATRSDETPRLRLTVVVTTSTVMKSMMKEITPRMEKFARLMGVPFEFKAVTSGLNRLGQLTKESLGVRDDEAVAVNCIGALRRVGTQERRGVIQMIQSINPKIVTIVEEEADFSSSSSNDFVKCFNECLGFYTIYFDMLDESFATTSNEKLALERECSRSIVRVLACDDEIDDHSDHGDCERRERGIQWSERLRDTGFSPVGYSDDIVDDVRALLKRYMAGWSLLSPPIGGEDHGHGAPQSGIYLTWKDEPIVWASVWKP